MGLLADAGPGLIDDAELEAWRSGGERPPDGAGAIPEAPPEPIDESVRWEAPKVIALLRVQGYALHALASGGHPDAWKYTSDDLEAIAPPLTAILNRYPVSRAMAAAGDELALAAAITSYTFRSVRQRGQAIAASKAAELELDGEDDRPYAPDAAGVRVKVNPNGTLEPMEAS